MDETVSEIKEKLSSSAGEQLTELLMYYSSDKRSGVQAELERYRKQKDRQKKLQKSYRDLTVLERSFYEKGFESVAGVDEAGRGPLAGPIVAAAVILPIDCYIEGLKDCKQLLPQQRERLYVEIFEKAVSLSVAEVSSFEIDADGLQAANLKVLTQAVMHLDKKPEFVLSDGFKIDCDCPSLRVIKGDSISASIAAASIIAKVHRDRLMEIYHDTFPDYAFNENKGYSTPEHKEIVKRIGPCSIHRLTFEPVRLALEEKLSE